MHRTPPPILCIYLDQPISGFIFSHGFFSQMQHLLEASRNDRLGNYIQGGGILPSQASTLPATEPPIGQIPQVSLCETSCLLTCPVQVAVCPLPHMLTAVRQSPGRHGIQSNKQS